MSANNWQMKHYDAEKAELAATVAVSFPKVPAEALRFAFKRAMDDEQWSGDGRSLARLLLLIHVLRSSSTLSELTPGQEQAVANLGEKILRANKVQPHVSRMAFLYVELQDAMAACVRRRGDLFRAQWLMGVGRRQKTDGPSVTDERASLLAAEDAVQAGDSRRALMTYDDVAESAQSAGMRREGLLGQLRALRLSDDRVEFQMLAKLHEQEAFDDDQLWRWRWEVTSMQATTTGDLSALVRHVEQVDVTAHADKMLVAYLRVRAAQTQALDDRIVPPRLILRRVKRRMNAPPTLAEFCDVASVLERVDDSAVPLRERLLNFGEALARAPALPDPEHRLALWAAATRWLVQHHQPHLAELSLAEYQKLSQILSAGRTKDLYAIFADIEQRLLLNTLSLPVKAIDMPPALRLSHTWHDTAFELSRMFASLTRLIASRDLRLNSKVTFAEAFARFAASRRGVLLKVAQTFSSLDGILGETLHESFDSLYVSIPAMPSATVRDVFQQELGRAPEDIFATFDYQPFSAGSIGQVHIATLADGRQLAVKVQYPAISKVVAMDMRQAKLLRPFILAQMPQFDFDGVFNELQDHLMRELDYRLELRNLNRFRQFFADDPRVLIPEPFPELSSPKILTMAFVAGASAVDFASQASQEERNDAAATVIRMVARSHYQLGSFNPDIHGSNFVFRKDGVGFIDFGSVKSFAPESLVKLKKLQRSLFDEDPAAFEAAFLSIGYYEDRSQVDWRRLFELHLTAQRSWLSRTPFVIDEAFVSEQRAALNAIGAHAKSFKVPKDMILSVRCDPAVCSMLSALKPVGLWRTILEPIMTRS